MADYPHQKKDPIVITLGGNKRAQRDAVAEFAIAFLSQQPGRYSIDAILAGDNSAGEYDKLSNLPIDTDQSRPNTMSHLGVDPSSAEGKRLLQAAWVVYSYWCLYQPGDDCFRDGIGDIVKGSRMSHTGRAKIITPYQGLADLAEQALQEKNYPILKRTGHPQKPNLNNTRLYSLARYIAATARQAAYGLSAWSSANFP